MSLLSEKSAYFVDLLIQKSITQFLILCLFSGSAHLPMSLFWLTFLWTFMPIYFSICPARELFVRLSLHMVYNSPCFILLL